MLGCLVGAHAVRLSYTSLPLILIWHGVMHEAFNLPPYIHYNCLLQACAESSDSVYSRTPFGGLSATFRGNVTLRVMS